MFISHGAGEHCQRYGHIAAALTEMGAFVYAHDHGECRKDTVIWDQCMHLSQM